MPSGRILPLLRASVLSYSQQAKLILSVVMKTLEVSRNYICIDKFLVFRSFALRTTHVPLFPANPATSTRRLGLDLSRPCLQQHSLGPMLSFRPGERRNR